MEIAFDWPREQNLDAEEYRPTHPSPKIIKVSIKAKWEIEITKKNWMLIITINIWI